MSSGIHVNGKAVRDYAQKLGTYSQRVEELFDQIGRDASKLGESWQDPGFVYFRDSFSSSRRALHEFNEEVKSVLPKLNQHADLVDQYANKQVPG